MKSKLFLIALVAIASLQACFWSGYEVWPEGDPHWNPVPIVTPDTCENYQAAEFPHYVQGWVEMDGPPNGWELHVGPYTDTIHAGEEDQLDLRLSLLINAFLPQYQTVVYSRSDAQRIATFTTGTDDKNTLNFKVWIHVGNAKYYPAFTKRGFVLGGAATKDEFVQLAKEYRSMIVVNYRDIETDSLGEKECMLAVLDSCKDGTNKTVNFQFNQFAEGDSISGAFTDAGWTVYNPFTGLSGSNRVNGKIVGRMKGNTLDTRGFKVTDEDIMAILDRGIPVIAY